MSAVPSQAESRPTTTHQQQPNQVEAPRTSKDWGIMLVIKFCYVPKVYLSYNDIGTTLTPNRIHLFTPYATECLSWTAITQLAHHGMLYVPIGYTFGAGMFKMDSIRGGSPYGAGVFSGDGTREPSDTELALAEHQGKYMAGIVKSIIIRAPIPGNDLSKLQCSFLRHVLQPQIQFHRLHTQA
uniref:Flavoprotein wrbA n=1 Tax=Quercus lobata TaxID=97700 RepID=A0A7N2MZL9_QUELO